MSKSFHKEQIKRFLLEEKIEKDEEPELLNEAWPLVAAIVAGLGALGYAGYANREQFDYSAKWKRRVGAAYKNPEAFDKLLDDALFDKYTSDASAKAALDGIAAAIGRCKHSRTKKEGAYDSYAYCKQIKKILRKPGNNPFIGNPAKYSRKNIEDQWHNVSAVQDDLKDKIYTALPKLANFKLGAPPEDDEDFEKDGPKGSKGPSFGNLKKAKGEVIAVYGTRSKVFVPGVSTDRFDLKQRILFSTTFKDSFEALAKGKCDLGSMYDKSTDSCIRISRPELKISSHVVTAQQVEGGTELIVNKGKNWGINIGANVRFPGASSSSGTGKRGRTGGGVKCSSKLLKRGCRGSLVTKLQTRLKQLNYDLGKYGVDGKYGGATAGAVSAFQKDSGLGVDGVAGKNTLAALFSKAATQKASVPAADVADAGPKASKVGGGVVSQIKAKADRFIQTYIDRARREGVSDDKIWNIVKNYNKTNAKAINTALEKVSYLKESNMNKVLADHKEQVLVERLEKLTKGLV